MQSNFYSKKWRLSHLYKLVNKQGKTVNFVRNATQELLENKKRELREKFGRVRLIILKGRQSGVTTNEVISGLDDVIMKSNRNVGIIVNSDDARIEIFDKVKFANANFPQSIRLKN
ncbi:MAG: hypothetical protein LBU27_08960 [Candidatus Peribacteria bacterium]|jgi:hypothetical protein|nr:hypothetical protein [Candidatus Peribacteria bacterium]